MLPLQKGSSHKASSLKPGLRQQGQSVLLQHTSFRRHCR